MASILIRKAGAEHLADIPRIELAGAALFSTTDLPPNIRYKVTAAGDLQEAQGEGRIWVAMNDRQKVVGFALADVVDRQGYLTEVDVLPEFARRGIGTRLVQTVADWASASRFRSLSLVTFRHLPWNAPFYEKLGFRKLDSAEHGPELESLITEEGRLGINIANRVAMKLNL